MLSRDTKIQIIALRKNEGLTQEQIRAATGASIMVIGRVLREAGIDTGKWPDISDLRNPGPALKLRIIALRKNEGRTQTQIRAATGVSREVLVRVLWEAGIDTRKWPVFSRLRNPGQALKLRIIALRKNEGRTQRQISAATGVSMQMIGRVLREAGIDTRKWSDIPRFRNPGTALKLRIIALRKNKERTLRQISAATGVSIPVISRVLQEAGIDSRKWTESALARRRRVNCSDQKIIGLYKKGLTYESIGSSFKVTKERIRQIITANMPSREFKKLKTVHRANRRKLRRANRHGG